MSYLMRYVTPVKLLNMFKEPNRLLINFTRLDLLDAEGVIAQVYDLHELVNEIKDLKPDHYDEDKIKQLYAQFDDVIPNFYKNIEKLRNEYYASCWVPGDEENRAMWEQYAGKDGALIKVKKEVLIKRINQSFKNGSFDHRSLIYEKEKLLNKIKSEEGLKENKFLKYAPFYKDKYFTQEKEYRLLIRNENSAKSAHTVNIDLDKSLDVTVIFHPEIEQWVENTYRMYLEDSRGVRISDSQFKEIFKLARKLQKSKNCG